MLVARSLKPAVPYFAGFCNFKNYVRSDWSNLEVSSISCYQII